VGPECRDGEVGDGSTETVTIADDDEHQTGKDKARGGKGGGERGQRILEQRVRNCNKEWYLSSSTSLIFSSCFQQTDLGKTRYDDTIEARENGDEE